MGNVCACGSGNKPSKKKDNVKYEKNGNHEKTVVLESDKTEPSKTSESTTSIQPSQEIVDDNLKTQIAEDIDDYMASIPANYQAERDRIVEEMKRSSPERYLGLLLSDYPNVNGSIVNEMARRLVTSHEIKQRLINKIDEHIESSFQSRTADWNTSSRETARPVIKTYIEKLVNEAFNGVQLE